MLTVTSYVPAAVGAVLDGPYVVPAAVVPEYVNVAPLTLFVLDSTTGVEGVSPYV